MYNRLMLPCSVRAVLWSYDIKKIDPEIHAKLIISQVLNYGTRAATDWLFRFYGKDEVKRIASRIPRGQWDKKSLVFWSLVLEINPNEKKDMILEPIIY